MQDEASAKLSANERLAADFAEATQYSEGLETRLAAAESLLDAGTVRVSELQVCTPWPWSECHLDGHHTMGCVHR